ncbi:MAG TPA: carbon storage regulator [Gemmataceae bacterium]
MLVLSRKCGEKIVIPSHDIVLTVLEVRGDRIRFGISAPPHIPVHREEVWRQIQQAEAAAAGAAGAAN